MHMRASQHNYLRLSNINLQLLINNLFQTLLFSPQGVVAASYAAPSPSYELYDYGTLQQRGVVLHVIFKPC